MFNYMYMSHVIMMIILLNILINSEKSSSKLIFSLICMTIIISMMISSMSKNSWIGFSLFLIMVGGLMVLFLMVTSIIPKMITPSNLYSINFISPILLMMTFKEKMINMKSHPNLNFSFKMKMILMIIFILNIMLMMISKLLIMPSKPFRSI